MRAQFKFMIDEQSRSEIKLEWIAKYDNGEIIKQFDTEKNEEHHFGHIDPERIVEFILLSQNKKFSVNLLTGLFYIDDKKINGVYDDKGNPVPVGEDLSGKNISSSWGNKVKLIYYRHIRRDFNFSIGTMAVKMIYEIGWEGEIDGKHKKYLIDIDEQGDPFSPEEKNEGFEKI